jgi:hypothetical protein
VNETSEQISLDDQDDAARFLRISPRTLERMRWAGEGPPFLKIGRKVLYDREDLLAWARSHRRTSTL